MLKSHYYFSLTHSELEVIIAISNIITSTIMQLMNKLPTNVLIDVPMNQKKIECFILGIRWQALSINSLKTFFVINYVAMIDLI